MMFIAGMAVGGIAGAMIVLAVLYAFMREPKEAGGNAAPLQSGDYSSPLVHVGLLMENGYIEDKSS